MSERCGYCEHDGAAHEHYRKGTECALCACPKFSAQRGELNGSPLAATDSVRTPERAAP